MGRTKRGSRRLQAELELSVGYSELAAVIVAEIGQDLPGLSDHRLLRVFRLARVFRVLRLARRLALERSP